MRRSSSPLTRSTAHSSASTTEVTANDRISELMPSRLCGAAAGTTAAGGRKGSGGPGGSRAPHGSGTGSRPGSRPVKERSEAGKNGQFFCHDGQHFGRPRLL
ncbi:hypothetical protein HEK616_22550 [Streptomyces nigrescens]|uniref:Uncharacterized protein n=1 Tax=Streptomyces nigrescens TaxID=1920 RepID=A0ABM7ZQV1_STRNI|nr:hypothetical protein HEK616_22550 [Streptomyces nigrescens]